jgi:F-type H+-transporting ATPase subunit epsilon
MAADKLTLEIVTPRGSALREDVDDVAAPSEAGELGVLPGHLQLVASLRPGLVAYHQRGEEKRLAIGEGFIEVKDDRVLILTDKVAKSEEIDPVPVRLELKDVGQKLDQYDGPPNAPEWQDLLGREAWAAVQLELVGDAPHATRRPYEAETAPAPPEDGPTPEA